MQTPYGVFISNTNIKKLQTIQKKAFFIVIGCTQDTKIQGLHDKTSVLPMGTHLKVHAIHLKQMTQTQTYSLHYLNAHLDPRIN